MIKALVLDFDGVIRDMDMERTEQMMRRIGLSPDEFFSRVFTEEHINDLITGKISIEEWWSYLREKYPEFKEVDSNFIWDEVFAYSVINDDVLEIVREVGDKMQTAILTNAAKEWLPTIMEQIEGTSFDHIFTSGYLGVAKPHPEVYKKVLKELDVLPEECLFLDDKLRNVDGAKELGINAHIFQSEEQIRSLLKNYCN